MTVEWGINVQGARTIKAGQAIVFASGRNDITQTVTEGTNGKAAVDACIDEQAPPPDIGSW